MWKHWSVKWIYYILKYYFSWSYWMKITKVEIVQSKKQIQLPIEWRVAWGEPDVKPRRSFGFSFFNPDLRLISNCRDETLARLGSKILDFEFSSHLHIVKHSFFALRYTQILSFFIDMIYNECSHFGRIRFCSPCNLSSSLIS